MRVIGLDPGCRRAGYAVLRVEGSSLTLRESGVIASKGPGKLDRLKRLYHEIQAVLAMYNPTHAGVESGYVGKGARSSLVLGEARGVCLLAVARLAVVEIAPAQAKRACGLRGNATKVLVQVAIRRIFGLEIALEEDAADAAAVALAAANRVGSHVEAH